MNKVPKVGDRLICVFPDSAFLLRGHVYTVEEVLDRMVGLNVMRGHLWALWRFEPAVLEVG
jgi:hypothetical protein